MDNQKKNQIKDQEYNTFQLKQNLEQLVSTQSGRRAFLASLPVLVAACAQVPQTRHREGDNSGQETQITIADEKKMTQEYLPQMAKEYPPIQDSRLQSYLQKVGKNMAIRSGNEGNPYNYNFTLAQSSGVNAFALPAGTVFVTAPLLAMAESEAELAGVIGHEIGHVKARHTAERIDQEKKSQNKSLLYTLGGGVLGGLLGYGLGKAVCRKNDKECLQRVAMYGAAAGGAGGLLIQKFAFMAHSREDEMEADRVSFRTGVAGGYHKDHVGRFYNKLLAMEQQYKQSSGQNNALAPLADAMSTHPPSIERVQQIQQMASQEPLKSNAIITTREFQEVKAKVQSYVKKA